MKKFFIFFLFCGAIAGAAYFLYEPFFKERIDPLADKGIGAGEKEAVSTPEGAVAPQPKSDAPKSSPIATKPDQPKEAPKSEIDLQVEKRYPMPKILPLNEIVGDWNSVPRNAYPRQVTSTEPVPFQMVSSTGQVIGETKVQPGTPLTPLILSGQSLQVASIANANMKSQVDVDLTDFKSQIEARYNAFVDQTETRVMALRERARKVLQEKPELMASGPTGDQDDPRFAPVKASLQRGEAANVNLTEVTSFRHNGTETVGGDLPGSYETVSVNFDVQTIFGTFPTEYKCLLQGGRVVGWIDPITEERI